MKDSKEIIARIILAIIVFILIIFTSIFFGSYVFSYILDQYPPIVGEPSTDPHGRGASGAVDVLNLGPLILIVMGAAGSWISILLTYREYRTVDLIFYSISFLPLSIIAYANYVNLDVVITRDSQSMLNIALILCGITTSMYLYKSLRTMDTKILKNMLTIIFALFVYLFVVIPMWYTISFLSWKIGAGEIKSLDGAAKVLGAAIGIATTIGILRKKKEK